MAQNRVPIDGETMMNLLEQLAFQLPDDEYIEHAREVRGAVLAMYFPELEYPTTTDADVFDYHHAELPDKIFPYIQSVAKDNSIGYDWFNDAIMRHDDPEYIHNLKYTEYVNFIENINNPQYFYNQNGQVVMAMYHLSILGLIASKLMAGRDKDFETLSRIVPTMYNTPEEVIEDFHTYALSFVNTEHYQVVESRIYELF